MQQCIAYVEENSLIIHDYILPASQNAVDAEDSSFAFDGHASFEGKAEFGEELNGGIDVFHHDADVVHSLDCHNVSLASTSQVRRAVKRRLHLWVRLFSLGRSRSDPSNSNRGSPVATEGLNRAHIPLDHPIIDISNAEIIGVVDVVDQLLPDVLRGGLSRTRLFRVQLFDRKAVFARNGDVMRIAVRAHRANREA